jgi:hypothetical protein
VLGKLLAFIEAMGANIIRSKLIENLLKLTPKGNFTWKTILLENVVSQSFPPKLLADELAQEAREP